MSTQTLQIELPTEIAERIRDHVRSGEYASESDVIADRFLHEPDPAEDLSPEEQDEAFRLGFEALEELERHPETVVTMEQMRADHEEQHRRYTRAA